MRSNYYADDLEHDIVGSVPHDVYYLAPRSVDPNSLYIQVNRAGIVLQTPRDFLISRDDAYPYSMIHCVMYGKGTVSTRGHTFGVHAGQLFVMASNEGHMYSTDPKDPLGLVWVEYAGGNSAQLTRHILDLGGPIYEGGVLHRRDEYVHLDPLPVPPGGPGHQPAAVQHTDDAVQAGGDRKQRPSGES